MLLSPALPFPPATGCPNGGATRSFSFLISLVNRLVPTQYHSPTRESPFSVPAYGSHSLPESESATSPPSLTSPRLSDYQRHALYAAKIASNISPRSFRSAVPNVLITYPLTISKSAFISISSLLFKLINGLKPFC